MQGVVQLKNWARKERLALKDNLVLRKKKEKTKKKKSEGVNILFQVLLC